MGLCGYAYNYFMYSMGGHPDPPAPKKNLSSRFGQIEIGSGVVRDQNFR